ncbi:Rtg2 protein [Pichia kluyveri]|uniref:Rtg2 protein n=1 Tax=Pichia kluyveri TaxID=36015 RepID=A0AAV5QYN5_PICKL|nr:Rtg2 protein [Pichia kluyveri]
MFDLNPQEMSFDSTRLVNTPDSHILDDFDNRSHLNLNLNHDIDINDDIIHNDNDNDNDNDNINDNTNHNHNHNDNENEASIVARALTAIVDIGSNGIRFSISSKAPHHARIMPCVFKDRLGISLFDAQINNENNHLKNPIPEDAINEIIRSMRRFKWICEDFGVPSNGVKVVATEATREASNSIEFMNKIFNATGWKVQLLSKEEEGIVGSYGVASSFQEVSGLFMDLGGGSTQLSWIISKNGEVKISETPVSLPYGAAALTNRIKNEDINDLFLEIKNNYKMAIEKIQLPKELLIDLENNNGLKLFCCGGGLRGLGHLLIANEIDYPIQTIINGYSTTFNKVENMSNYLLLKKSIPKLESNKIFCVSNRREQQLPSVGLLLSAAFESLPKIRTVHFSEGGVREGVLYQMFDKSIKSEDPIITATRPYSPLLAHNYMELLKTGLPKTNYDLVPEEIENRILPALCNIAFVHCSYPKELQPTAALHVATSGIISGSHGLSHRTRALIGIALCERWGAELPSSEIKYYSNLEKLVIESAPRRGERMIYWTKLIGKMMHVICGIHPGGNIRPGSLLFEFINDKEIIDEKEKDTRNKTKHSLIITLPNDGIKYSYSIKSRALGFQKKIKKLNKMYSCADKVKVVVKHSNI